MANLAQIPWWEWIPRRSWRIVAIVAAADEVPDRLPRNAAILVGTSERPKWLAFDCPCKAHHRILITLDREHYPHWRIDDQRKLTVSPSVDFRSYERRCHYLLKQGKVVWVHEKEERHHGRRR